MAQGSACHPEAIARSRVGPNVLSATPLRTELGELVPRAGPTDGGAAPPARRRLTRLPGARAPPGVRPPCPARSPSRPRLCGGPGSSPPLDLTAAPPRQARSVTCRPHGVPVASSRPPHSTAAFQSLPGLRVVRARVMLSQESCFNLYIYKSHQVRCTTLRHVKTTVRKSSINTQNIAWKEVCQHISPSGVCERGTSSPERGG